jgi:hypothetical protein
LILPSSAFQVAKITGMMSHWCPARFFLLNWPFLWKKMPFWALLILFACYFYRHTGFLKLSVCGQIFSHSFWFFWDRISPYSLGWSWPCGLKGLSHLSLLGSWDCRRLPLYLTTPPAFFLSTCL